MEYLDAMDLPAINKKEIINYRAAAGRITNGNGSTTQLRSHWKRCWLINCMDNLPISISFAST